VVRALAQGNLDPREVRCVRRVRPEELPPDLAKSAAGPVRISAADDQCAGHVRVPRAELQRDLSPVAVAAHHRAIQTELGDQYRDVVRDLGEGHETGGIGRASVATTVGRDHAQSVAERREQRLPHGTRYQPAVDQDHRCAGAVLLHVHRCPVHLDRATFVSVHAADAIPRDGWPQSRTWLSPARHMICLILPIASSASAIHPGRSPYWRVSRAAGAAAGPRCCRPGR
jgi:hypothetical protein